MERDPKGAPEILARDWRPGWEEAGVGKGFMQWLVRDWCGYLLWLSFSKLHIWEGGTGRLCFEAFFCCFVFCFERAWIVCFASSFHNENFQRKQQHLSLFQSPEALESYFSLLSLQGGFHGGQDLRAFVLYWVITFMELLKDLVYLLS